MGVRPKQPGLTSVKMPLAAGDPRPGPLDGGLRRCYGRWSSTAMAVFEATCR